MCRLKKAVSKTELEELMSNEVKIYAGTRTPVKASALERIIKRRVACNKLHPNPDDEFTDPKIGPNYQIVSSYVDAIKKARFNAEIPWIDDPIEYGFDAYQLDAPDEMWKEKIIEKAEQVKRKRFPNS